MNNKPGKYFLLLNLSFILLVIIPVAIVGAYTVHRFTKTLSIEMERHSKSVLGYVQKAVDESLLQIERDLYKIQESSFYRDLINKTLPQNQIIYSSRMLQEEIHTTVTTGEMIHSIMIYFPLIDRVLTDSSTSNINNFANSKLIEKVQDNPFFSGPYLLTDQDPLVITTEVYSITRTQPIGSNTPKSIIMVNLNTDFINSLLASLAYTSDMIIQLKDDNDQLIFSSGLKESNVSKYSEFYHDSQYRSWQYSASLRNSYFHSKINPLKYLILLLCLGLIIIGIGISLLLSRILYNPIGKILSNIQSSASATEFKGRNELQYIDTAIQQFIDSNRHLQSFVQRNRDSIRGSFFKRLLEGIYIPPEELLESLDYLKLKDRYNCYTVAAFEIDQTVAMTPTKQTFFRRMGISNIINEQSLQQGITCKVILLQQARVHAVFFSDLEEVQHEAEIISIASTTNELVYDLYDMTLTAGIGTTEGRLQLISQSWEMANRALTRKFVLGGNKIISFRQLPDQERTFSVYPLLEIKKLAQLTVLAEKEEMQHSVEAMINVLKSEQTSEIGIQSVLMQVFGNISEYLGNRGLSLDMLLGENRNLLLELDKLHSFDETGKWFIEVLNQISCAIVMKKEIYSPAIVSALDFITRNYMKNISLSDVSDHLGITQQYFSKRFKEELGENYIDFLNRFRLEKAEELLLNSEKAIKEIAVICGFTNSQYFIKRFKEKYHSTPAAYRQK